VSLPRWLDVPPRRPNTSNRPRGVMTMIYMDKDQDCCAAPQQLS
jgi:hypothetical protein